MKGKNYNEGQKNRVCPVENAHSLDTRIRRWLQNPSKILRPYLKEGMTALDFGCGPGFFTIDMAKLVGETGRVIAVDLQEGMLQILQDKTKETDFAERITLHQCEANKIGITNTIDFALAFYVLHELPNQEDFFNEIASILKPGGKLLIVEPPFHASNADFQNMIKNAEDAGLKPEKAPGVFLNKSVIFNKS